MNTHRESFAGDGAGVRAARTWLRQHVGAHPHVAAIELCATELTTNAIQHTGSRGRRFTVTVERETAGTRVTVEDCGGDRKPEVPPAGADDCFGRGLLLVGALSDGWGADGDASGRALWAWWDA